MRREEEEEGRFVRGFVCSSSASDRVARDMYFVFGFWFMVVWNFCKRKQQTPRVGKSCRAVYSKWPSALIAIPVILINEVFPDPTSMPDHEEGRQNFFGGLGIC